MIRQLGDVPEPVAVLWNNPKLAEANQEFSAKVGEWDAADASLKTFAHMAVAAQVGCSWCLDVNYFHALNQNLDLARASQVPRWRQSEVFSPLERDVLEYAEAAWRHAPPPPGPVSRLSVRVREEDVAHGGERAAFGQLPLLLAHRRKRAGFAGLHV
jgi:alkylhydroperoxidase family enzyme